MIFILTKLMGWYKVFQAYKMDRNHGVLVVLASWAICPQYLQHNHWTHVSSIPTLRTHEIQSFKRECLVREPRANNLCVSANTPSEFTHFTFLDGKKGTGFCHLYIVRSLLSKGVKNQSWRVKYLLQKTKQCFIWNTMCSTHISCSFLAYRQHFTITMWWWERTKKYKNLRNEYGEQTSTQTNISCRVPRKISGAIKASSFSFGRIFA